MIKLQSRHPVHATLLLVAVVLIASFAATPAKAGVANIQDGDENFSVSNNSTTYATLEEAAAAVDNFGTVTMLQDVTVTAQIVLDEGQKLYTIDFNGHTLTSAATGAALLLKSSSITLEDSAPSGDENSIAASGTAISAAPEGENSVSLDIESGNYYGKDAVIVATGNSDVWIAEGRFRCDDSSSTGCIVQSNGGKVQAKIYMGAVVTVNGTLSAEYRDNPAAKEVIVRAPQNDQEVVDSGKMILTWNDIKDKNENQNDVRNDLKLITTPASTFYPYTISWTSSNTAVINPATGKVTRPALGSSDAVVTLTATITKGSASAIKEFVVTVPAQTNENFSVSNSLTTYETLEAAAAAVDNDGVITMRQNVTVPGQYGMASLIEDKNYTIDFGGHTFGAYYLRIDKGTIRMRNGIVNSPIGLNGSPGEEGEEDVIPELIIESGTYNATDTWAAIDCSGYYGRVTIISGSFSATNTSCLKDGYDPKYLIELSPTSSATVNGLAVSDDSWKNNSDARNVVVTAAATGVGNATATADPILSTQYCTLQGVAVKQPQAGQLYIVKEIRQSGKTTSELRFY